MRDLSFDSSAAFKDGDEEMSHQIPRELMTQISNFYESNIVVVESVESSEYEFVSSNFSVPCKTLLQIPSSNMTPF